MCNLNDVFFFSFFKEKSEHFFLYSTTALSSIDAIHEAKKDLRFTEFSTVQQGTYTTSQWWLQMLSASPKLPPFLREQGPTPFLPPRPLSRHTCFAR